MAALIDFEMETGISSQSSEDSEREILKMEENAVPQILSKTTKTGL